MDVLDIGYLRQAEEIIQALYDKTQELSIDPMEVWLSKRVRFFTIDRSR